MRYKCPVCHGDSVFKKGTLISRPDRDLPFPSVPAVVLLRCPACSFEFKWPLPDREQVDRFYAQLPDDVWKVGIPSASVFRDLAAEIEACAPERSIIDVGTYNGDFLGFFGPDWVKMGIEPCKSARAQAQRRGIALIGETLETTPAVSRPAGVVTLLDVLEHCFDPLKMLRRARDFLVRDGVLVIMTGDTGTFPFRLFGSWYWYYTIDQHVSFFNVSWFSWAAQRLKMRVVSVRLAVCPQSFRSALGQFVRFSIRNTRQGIEQRLAATPVDSCVPGLRRMPPQTSVPWWVSARDHMVVTMRPV